MFAHQYFKGSTAGILLVAAAFFLLSPAVAGSPDPILSGPAPGPCAQAAAGAEYADGVDATGNRVVPAEGPDATTAMGDGTVMVNIRRAHGRDVSVPVHLADLSKPACTPPRPPR